MLKEKLLLAGVSAQLLLPSFILAKDSPQCEGAKAVGGSCGSGDFTNALNSIIDTVFYVIGSIAVLIILVGAIRYITSTGDAKRIQQAKDTILYALFGLILAIVARAIVSFVITRLV